jgi:thioredoxin reductase (NADPH)
MYDTIIIGSGVTGLAAAMYAGRLHLNPLVLGDTPGGTITTTHVVENYPGFISVTGKELADAIQEHTESYNVDINQEKVTRIEKNDCFIVSGKNVYKGKSIIFATGTEYRKLTITGADLPGVHYCALCDGPLYTERTVAVVGGSDSAAKEALLLAEYARKVYIIYRGNEIHPEPVNMSRVQANERIEVINNTSILEIHGEKQVQSLVLDNPYNNSTDFSVDGLFVAIGLVPLSDIAKDLGLETNEKREIIVDKTCKTSVKGVFAAGDVTDTDFKQAIVGVAQGVTAAYEAYKYVKEKDVWPCG